jgi:hypothetical protein
MGRRHWRQGIDPFYAPALSQDSGISLQRIQGAGLLKQRKMRADLSGIGEIEDGGRKGGQCAGLMTRWGKDSGDEGIGRCSAGCLGENAGLPLPGETVLMFASLLALKHAVLEIQ